MSIHINGHILLIKVKLFTALLGLLADYDYYDYV